MEVNLSALWVNILLLDGLIHAGAFGFLGYVLWFVVLFGRFSGIKTFQRLLNALAFLVLLLAVWMFIPFLFERLLWEEHLEDFKRLIPLKIVFGLLTLTLMRFFYKDLAAQLETIGEDEDAQLPEIMEPLNTSEMLKETLTTISVRTGQKIHMIAIKDVLFLKADGDYVLIHTADGKHLKEQTMKYFEMNLPSEEFVRIHRSCIVHTTFITRIELYEKQNYLITLKTGHQLKASQTGYRLLKQLLKL